ncbi:MAG: distal tail protein Dit, partial [Candidatus Paceibacterota bacterium]
MREYVDFVYDGKTSWDMGVIQAYRDSSLYEEDFLSNRSIKEEKVRGNDTPYLFSVEKEPYSFELGMFFEKDISNAEINLRKIARWLDKSYYKPFYFKDKPDQIFYCMPTETPSMAHSGIKKGFISLTMRCNSPYSYSPV